MNKSPHRQGLLSHNCFVELRKVRLADLLERGVAPGRELVEGHRERHESEVKYVLKYVLEKGSARHLEPRVQSLEERSTAAAPTGEQARPGVARRRH
mgnify:CR=1 FL=1